MASDDSLLRSTMQPPKLDAVTVEAHEKVVMAEERGVKLQAGGTKFR
jgi:hypothetical protein